MGVMCGVYNNLLRGQENSRGQKEIYILEQSSNSLKKLIAFTVKLNWAEWKKKIIYRQALFWPPIKLHMLLNNCFQLYFRGIRGRWINLSRSFMIRSNGCHVTVAFFFFLRIMYLLSLEKDRLLSYITPHTYTQTR